MLVDEGLIGSTIEVKRQFRKIESQIGEFVDVLAVAMGKKPLAALDVQGTLARKGLDQSWIQQILKNAKSKGVKLMKVIPSIDGWGRGGYLRDVFFKPRNKWRALALMGILWGCQTQRVGCGGLRGWKFHAAIGYLLGYRRKNIREFVRIHTGRKNITPKEFSDLIKRVKAMRFHMNEDGFYNPVLKSTNVLQFSR